MEKYEITKESILAAANKCSTAKDILKTMFPKAFEEDDDNLAMAKDLDPITFDEKICDVLNYMRLGKSEIQLINISGKIDGIRVFRRGLWLSSNYDWKFQKSVSSGYWLVPFKRRKY